MFAQTIARRRPASPLRHRSLLDAISERVALHRQRQRLAGLPDYLLDDVGLTRREALQEADRPAWDAPEHWRS